jgi:hypothetical protein
MHTGTQQPKQYGILRGTILFLVLATLSQPGAAQHINPFRPINEPSRREKKELFPANIFETHKGGETQAIQFFSNYRLDRMDTAIHTLLINIHGLYRNALGAYESVIDAVHGDGENKTTLTIAPHYTNQDDLENYRLPNKFLYWKNAEWKDGRQSITDDWRGNKVSMNSYEIMDSLITFVLGSGKFPNIQKVIVAGHSSGGQFVQRYSAITPLPDLLPAVRFRFIIMNPSSYLYLDERRPAANGNFAVPDSTGCGGYNRYPKGLEELSDYALATGADRIRKNMLTRDIVILLGGDDTDDADRDLDVTCAAELQGNERLSRGLNFFNYLSSFAEYGQKKNCNVIRRVRHNGKEILNSDEGKKWLFEW